MPDLGMGYREHPASAARRKGRCADEPKTGRGEPRKKRKPPSPLKWWKISKLREGKRTTTCDHCGGLCVTRDAETASYCSDPCFYQAKIDEKEGSRMIELDTKETIRRNRYRKPEPETKNEADPPTPRECGICGDTFYASAGFVCSQCKEERDARRSEKWEDPDEHFDPKDPSYKIYRRRLWIRHWEYPNPYDYIGRTGNERIMQRICGEYSFTKRFPELLLPSVEEDDVLIIRKFPWSVDGSDRSAVAEIVEILDSAIDPNTVTLNWQYVPKKMRQVGKWKAAQKIMRSAAMGLG